MKKINKRLQSTCVSFAEMSINTEYYIHEQQESNEFQENMNNELKNKKRAKNVLLIPPDPHWNGNMYMPFINDLFSALDEEEISVMRFTFNQTPILNDNYTKYIIQASLCLEHFIHETNFLSDFFVVGYSFGALIALLLALRRPEIVNFIMVSPPLLHYDFFSNISTLRMNGLCIYGTKDEIIPEGSVEQFVAFLKTKMIFLETIQVEGANHYLHEKSSEVVKNIIKYIEDFQQLDLNDIPNEDTI